MQKCCFGAEECEKGEGCITWTTGQGHWAFHYNQVHDVRDIRGYYCDAQMKSGLQKEEFKSRKPTENLCPWTGCELIKVLTGSISNVNGKEESIIFLLIPKLLLDGLYQNIPGTWNPCLSSLYPIRQVWISEMSFINLIWTH